MIDFGGELIDVNRRQRMAYADFETGTITYEKARAELDDCERDRRAVGEAFAIAARRGEAA